MSKTPVKERLPIADGTLFSTEARECGPIVPKRPRIESPSSTKTLTPAKSQKGHVQNGSKQANGLAIVVESPNAIGNGSPAASSNKNGLSIGSPQIESLALAGSLEKGSRKELSQQATVASPIQFSVPAVSREKNEDFKRLLESLLAGSHQGHPQIATVASPIQSSVQNGSKQANGLPIVVESPDTIGNGSASSDKNGLSIGSPHQIESLSPAGSSEEGSRKELPQQATVASPIQSSAPAVSPVKNEDFKRLLESLLARSVPDGSKKPNGGSVAFEPPVSSGLRERLSQLATVASPIQSSVQNGSEQANGLPIVVESPVTAGNGSLAASSDQNVLSTESPRQTQTSSPAESLEATKLSLSEGESSPLATVASSSQSSVQNGSEQVNGLEIVVESPNATGNGFSAALSDKNRLSPFPGPPEPSFSEGFKRLIEKLKEIDSVARSVPNGSKKPKKSAAFEPSISSGLRERLSQLDPVATIESFVPATLEQDNGLAIVVKSPTATGNGSPAASSDQNVLSIESPHRTQTSSPAESLEEGSRKELSQQATVASSIQSSVPAVSREKNEDFKRLLESLLARSVPDGSKKPNGGSVALEPPVSSGLRERLSRLDPVATIESFVPATLEQDNGLAIVVKSPIAVGNRSPAVSSDQNVLSMESPQQIETLSSAGSLEERSRKELSQESTVASSIQSSVSAVSREKNEDFKRLLESLLARSVPNGSKKPNGGSVAFESRKQAGLRERLSQVDPVAIESSVPATPDQVNGLVNAVESPISVESVSPTASFDQNGLPMAVRSPIRTKASFPTESFEEGSRKELSQQATVASPIQSSVPAVSREKNEDFKRLLESLLAGSHQGHPQIATVASPIQSSGQNGSKQANGLPIVVESADTIGNGSASSDKNGLSIGSPHQIESLSPAGSSKEGSRKELPQQATVASPIQSSAPAVSPVKNEDFKRLLESLLARSVPDGSKKPNGGSVALEPSISSGLRERLSQLATVASSTQSSVQNGSEQANALAIVVESPVTAGNGYLAASSDQNVLSIESPRQTETSSRAESLEEREPSPLATVASPIQSSGQNGSKQGNGLAIVVESPDTVGNGSAAALSDKNRLSPFPGPPEPSFSEGFKRLIEKLKEIDRVARSVPNGSKKSNGGSVALEPPISAGSRKKLYQQAIVASPIQSSVQNGSKQANGHAIVVESPNTVGNGSSSASLDQNGLSIGLPRQTEDGSDKWSESPVAPGLLIPPTKMSVSAGSRKRPAQQGTSGSGEPNKLSNLADAGSTEPNKLPTTTGSKFPSFQAFANAFVGHWNTIHSCLTRISSMVVFLPNGEPVQLGSLLPAESPSTVARQPSPGSVAGPPAETSSAPLPQPQPEENGSESNDVEMEDEDRQRS